MQTAQTAKFEIDSSSSSSIKFYLPEYYISDDSLDRTSDYENPNACPVHGPDDCPNKCPNNPNKIFNGYYYSSDDDSDDGSSDDSNNNPDDDSDDGSNNNPNNSSSYGSSDDSDDGSSDYSNNSSSDDSDINPDDGSSDDSDNNPGDDSDNNPVPKFDINDYTDLETIGRIILKLLSAYCEGNEKDKLCIGEHHIVFNITNAGNPVDTFIKLVSLMQLACDYNKELTVSIITEHNITELKNRNNIPIGVIDNNITVFYKQHIDGLCLSDANLTSFLIDSYYNIFEFIKGSMKNNICELKFEKLDYFLCFIINELTIAISTMEATKGTTFDIKFIYDMNNKNQVNLRDLLAEKYGGTYLNNYIELIPI